MPNTTYGTPYAQSSDLVSNWPGVSSNVADRIDDVSFKGNGLNDQTGTSYTLVLTDAGKTVTLNNASAVTVTVPTNASVAYETGTVIQLTNKGAGVVTVSPAGGVTLNNSITLAQHASASIQKLDTNTWVMSAAGSLSQSLIVTGTLSGGTVTLSAIPGIYRDLRLVLLNTLPATDGAILYVRVNGDNTANRHYNTETTGIGPVAFSQTEWQFTARDNAVTQAIDVFTFYEYANTTSWKLCIADNLVNNQTTATSLMYRRSFAAYNQTTAITSLNLLMSAGNFTSGNYYLYGVR